MTQMIAMNCLGGNYNTTIQRSMGAIWIKAMEQYSNSSHTEMEELQNCGDCRGVMALCHCSEL